MNDIRRTADGHFRLVGNPEVIGVPLGVHQFQLAINRHRTHRDGCEFVLATPPKAPKLKALARNPKVALTIDDNSFPHKVLLERGNGTALSPQICTAPAVTVTT